MKVLVIIALCYLNLARAKHGDDCEVDLDYSWFLGYTHEKIPDNRTELVLKTIKAVNISEIKVADNRYLTAVLEEGEITYKLTENFKNHEKEIDNYYEDIVLSMEVDYMCENGTTSFRFYQPVEDLNNHVPFFNREKYTFKFGMKVPAGFELTNMMQILATDIDITDDDMEFSVDREELSIKNSYYSDRSGKTHGAILKTTKEIVETTNITISVKDTRGDEMGSAVVEIIIEL